MFYGLGTLGAENIDSLYAPLMAKYIFHNQKLAQNAATNQIRPLKKVKKVLQNLGDNEFSKQQQYSKF